MHSSTSNSEFVREIPRVSWRAVLIATTSLTLAATAAWEFSARAAGYAPSLNDTPDLWAEQRAKVKPDSIVLAGTSRMLFDIDLDVLERAFGRRPVQLAIAGSSPFPVLENLAADTSFRGTVIVDIVPAMFLAPPGSPPVETAQRALRRAKDQSLAQHWSHRLGVLLEERIAFLKQEDLTLGKLLERIPVPNRANALIAPSLPPYFYTVDHDRRGRMVEAAATVGSPLQRKVTDTWLPLFTLPPPPSYIPLEQFQAAMGKAIEQRFQDTARHVATLRARGAKVVFVRLPVTGPLVAQEEKIVPLAAGWGRLVRDSGVPAINFADHADLADFDCPEWSHLSAPDSIEFTKRLVPHLRKAFVVEETMFASSSASSPRSTPSS